MTDATRITTAMILGAGYGKRMAPLTDKKPKPLVEFCGKPLIEWPIERLAASGVERFVVNTHYLPEQMDRHFADRPEVTLTHEAEIQETGGGVRDALPLLGGGPFFATSSDVTYFDGLVPAADRMLQSWNPDAMDALLMLVRASEAHGYDGPGDYYLDTNCVASHRGDRQTAPFVFGGLQILKPSLFQDVPLGPFRLLETYHKAERLGRLHGITHDGEWFHIGTPQGLRDAEDLIGTGYGEANTR